MDEDKDEKNIFLETLEWVCGKLKTAGIPYMITGGSAVGFWGRIRTTLDIDILIQIHAGKTESFLKSIEKDVYLNHDEAKKAILDNRMFNVVLNKNCFRVDFIPLNVNDKYETEKFNNRIKLRLKDKEISVISPEDLIITKLLWNKSAGGSERQISDCESIYKLNSDSIDLGYIKKWVKILKIDDEWDKLLSEGKL